jgi:hypothetical protein
MGFLETQPKQLPKWLTGKDGQGHAEGVAFARSFGATKDTELALLKDAVKVRWPQVGPADALKLQGADRVLLQAPGEGDADFRLRMGNAHELWLWGGTHAGFIDRFVPFDYAPIDGNVHVYNNCEVVWDSNFLWFSRVFLILEIGWWNIDGVWDDPGDYDDGYLWDSTMLIEEADYIRKSLRAWKSDAAYPVTIGIALGGGSITDDGLWGVYGVYDDGGLWNDNTDAVTYLTLGHVWGEEAWLGGGPHIWDEPDDAWDDFVAPSGGWILPFCP